MTMSFLKDEYVIVLDFLSRGHASGRQERLAQVIGTKYFSLLEVVVRKDVTLKSGEKIYIGESKRDQVERIKRRIKMNDLTSFAKSELPFVVQKLIKENEEMFVEFFNNSRPLTTRLHQLELLPGVGKKHMWEIIKQRKVEKFKSFEDIKKRIKLMPDPSNAIQKRVLEELETDDIRYRLFVSGPVKRF